MDWKNNLIGSIPELLMLQMVGIGYYFPTGAAWYLSAMFLTLMILYPLALRYRSSYLHIMAPCISIILMGYILRSIGNIGNAPGQDLGFFKVGVWRAFADIAIGNVLWSVSEWLKGVAEGNKISALLLGIIEVGGYLLIAYIAKKCQPGYTDFYIVIIMCISLAITLSETSITYRLFNFKIWKVLGAFSSIWFLNNFYVAGYLPSMLPNIDGKKLLYVYIVISALVSGVVVVAVQLTNKILARIKVYM